MMAYLTHITTEGERWDQIAARYYGNALLYEPIIAANPRVPISPTLAGGQTIAIPIIERADLYEDIPPWLR
jgi:nucleoid-associated protein YgaU